jgi:peptide/nickel transport system ATP-binding protein
VTDSIFKVKDLQKLFPIQGGGLFNRVVGNVRAVDGINLEVFPGETLGLVGESGCGKSTAGRTMLRLIEPTAGSIEFNGQDITKLKKKDLVPLRREMQMIFQDPFSSLNPRHTIGDIIGAPFRVQGVKPEGGIMKAVQGLMDRVGLNPEHFNRYPNEFSGGQRQRIGIARALYKQASVLIFDEATSALDNTTELALMDAIGGLDQQLTIFFVAHRLSTVRHCDMLVELEGGKLKAKGNYEQLLKLSDSFRKMVDSGNE